MSDVWVVSMNQKVQASTMPPPSTNLRYAFSLLELLVTIAVVAILSSILVVSLSHVRQMANIATCSSSMRQIHTATMLYAGEHTNKLPGPLWSAQQAWYRAPEYIRDGVLLNYIAPYLDLPGGTSTPQRADIFLCPAWADQEGETVAENPSARVYAVQYRVTLMNGESIRPFGYAGGSSTTPPATLHELDNPGQQVMLFDLDADVVSSYRGNSLAAQHPVHGGKRNYLFFDGHVECLKEHI
ncbi:prepilin-type N-terminal cleavage/methylation domain-containing protein [Ruficoccus sp. ZRK36]|uniref:prepilin-type N-terminal cleavage/methylation domain-containing protein n=1 Tax=Ruficoccus sp. ZRK36 TaxID=2866311 RepID=UPI001C732783|nr:prepilin-type N-terminal cleavage/methylation domain-containing protein [Ruficoccus sp. ZRK36]QYY37264.1 prepilin-type N-terminal cleavage/methylation domain-containing protein [Ruficoccus sp. ZRK36]